VKIMNRRGQAAMEFLMTYGWAILVVLVAIGALAYFGVLSPDKFLPEKCVISSGSGLFCSNFNIDSTTGDIGLFVKNSLSDDIDVKASSSLKVDGAAVCTASTGPFKIDADKDNTVTFTGCGFSSGDKLKMDIAIDYDILDSAGAVTFSKGTTGTLVARAP
jgi:hypothetical protein